MQMQMMTRMDMVVIDDLLPYDKNELKHELDEFNTSIVNIFTKSLGLLSIICLYFKNSQQPFQMYTLVSC